VRTKRLLVCVLAAVLFGPLAVAQTAGAAQIDCDRSQQPFSLADTCYSIKWSNTGASTYIAGSQADVYMSPGYTSPGTDWFTVSAIWAGKTSPQRFVEAGYTNGWNFALGVPAYSVYTVHYDGTYSYNVLANIGAASNSRNFLLWHSGSNQWSAQITNGPEGTLSRTQGVGISSATWMQAGGEFFNNHGSAEAATFSMSGLTRYDIGSGSTVSWDAVGPGCLSADPGSRTGDQCLIHSGFNGVPYSNSQWDWNKPL